jgi:hypothetical protein
MKTIQPDFISQVDLRATYRKAKDNHLLLYQVLDIGA